jgi:hypothetical protein
MFSHDEDACSCGLDPEGQDESCSCNCESCGDEEEMGGSIITMTDTETGEEYSFTLEDDFVFEDEHYCVLVSTDTAKEPEMIIAKVVAMEDGSEGLMSLDDAEYDRVYAEYERICEEDTDEDEDDEET